MRETAEENADAHNAVADDHQRCIDGVSRQNGPVTGIGEHHRQNERCLDHGYGHGQDQGAKRFTNAMRRDFRVMDRSNNTADQTCAAQHGQRRAYTRADRDDQKNQGCRWGKPWPASNSRCGP